LYRLIPIDRGAHALVEVNQANLLPDEDDDAYKQMLKGPTDRCRLQQRQQPPVAHPRAASDGVALA